MINSTYSSTSVVQVREHWNERRRWEVAELHATVDILMQSLAAFFGKGKAENGCWIRQNDDPKHSWLFHKKRKFTDEQKQPALYIVHRDNPFVSSHADMLLKMVS